IEEAKRLAAEEAAGKKAARLAEAAKRRAETVKNKKPDVIQKADMTGGFAFVGSGLYKSLVDGLEETAEATTTDQPEALGLTPSKLGGPSPSEEASPSDSKVSGKMASPDTAAPDPRIAPAPATVRSSAVTAAPPKRPTAPVNARYARFLK